MIVDLAYLKDHRLNRYVWVHDVVTAPYVNRQDQFPVNLRFYQQFRVKYEAQLTSEMVQSAVVWGLPFQLVLWDSWFSRRPLIEQVEQLGKDWLGGCPKDRKSCIKASGNSWRPLSGHPR